MVSWLAMMPQLMPKQKTDFFDWAMSTLLPTVPLVFEGGNPSCPSHTPGRGAAACLGRALPMKQHWLPAAGALARVAPLLRAQALAMSQPGSPQPGCPLPQNQSPSPLQDTGVLLRLHRKIALDIYNLCALSTTCLLLLVSSLLAFRLGRSLRNYC